MEPDRAATGARSPSTRPRPVSLMGALVHYVPSYAMAVLGYVALTMVAARALGPAQFGQFVVILTVTALVGQLSLLGVHRAGLREAASESDPAVLAQLWRGVRAVIRVPLPVASVLTGAAAWAWSVAGSGADAKPGSAAVGVGVFTGLLVFAAGYQKVAANFLRGLGHARAANLVTGRNGGALVGMLQAACVLAVVAALPESGLAGVLAGTAVGFLVPLGWVWWLLRRTLPAPGAGTGTWRELRVVAGRDWRFAVSQTGGFANSTVELWLAGVVLPATATGLFAASQRASHLLLIPASALGVVFSPALARLAKRGDYRRMELLTRGASAVATVTSGVLWVPMMLVPGVVLTVVFGEGFEAAAIPLMLLSTGYLLNSVSGMSGITLSMAHHEGVVARLTWTAVAVRVLLGSAAAVAWGVTGLAVSALVVSTLYYFALWTEARRRVSVSTHATWRPRLALFREISG
jgi:O-antigen/teichoic acid export membrane protein